MAVLGRLLISSAERVDLSDLLSIDSYTAGDFKYFIKSMVGDSKPYILKGFDVIDPLNVIGTQSCSIRVANSVVYYPGSSAGSFFYGLDESNPEAAPLIPELRKNATNYVYLTFSTFNTSIDTRAFWDPDKDGGAGGEFTQDVNTESVLKVEVNVSTGAFPANTIPIAIINVGPVTIDSIEDARHLLYRLGSGGVSPDPLNTYNWQSYPSASYKRQEPPIKTYAGGVNPFQGADKNISSMKEWMDAIMSKLRELGGTTYWYEDASTYGLISNFIDSSATAFKSKGMWQHDSSTPGLLAWTEDLNIKITSDPRTYIIRSGNKTIANEQVMYVPMVRQNVINSFDEPVSWVNGANYVNTVSGAVGLFTNLSKGDYVKKVNDTNDKFLRVEEFYDAVNLGGSITAASTAKSIRLSSVYLGTTGDEKARYDKGVYEVSDLVVSDRNQSAISSIGGNFHWLAMRSDTIESIASITTTSLTLNISNHDGVTAKVTSSGSHGLIDGDRISISGSTNFSGTFKVEVESSTVFYISVTGGSFADESSVTGRFATVTTSARSNDYGLQLESANHGFNTNDMVLISGTTNYNHSTPVSISVRSATQFTIPVSSNFATETSVGLVTLAKVIVKSEGSIAQIIQGEVININVNGADNIRTYIGMSSISQTTPEYSIPTLNYNTLNGMVNYNSSSSDNLTTRVAKLTAMMADKAQDKTIKILPSNYESVTNITNGLYQDIVFDSLSSSARLDVVMPGSDFNYGSIILTGTLSLAANSIAYISINRNSTFSYANIASIPVSEITKLSIDENILILAVRLGTSEVWLWDGTCVIADTVTPTLTYLTNIVRQNQVLALVKGGTWSWNLLTNTLSNSASAYVQIPGVAENRNTILAQSIVLPADGYVAYVRLKRSTGVSSNLTVNVAAVSSVTLDNDLFIIARRNGNDVEVGESILLISGESKALYADDKVEKARVIDITSTTLPTGSSLTIDGVTLANGDKVLFTNLSTTSLRGIHAISGVGSSISWTQLDCFNGLTTPSEGALVAVQAGTYYNSVWGLIAGTWKPFNSLSSLSSAVQTNTIDNLNFAQTWNWSTITTGTSLSITANALTTGSILSLTTSNGAINSTSGLLYVANTSASTSGLIARIKANSTSGSGLTVAASGNIGIGTSSPSYALDVNGNVSAYFNMSNPSIDGHVFTVNFAPTSSPSTVTYSGHNIYNTVTGSYDLSSVTTNGSYVYVRNNANSGMAALIGSNILAKNFGTTGSIVSGYGVNASYANNDGGSTTNAYAINAVIEGNASSITNAYGLRSVITTSGSGTITNAYGLYIDNFSSTGITNKYGIYQNDSTVKNYFASQVGIGTTPNANAILDLSSTTKAFIPPRMTTTQKNAISSPVAGMVVYDSTKNLFYNYNGTTWVTLGQPEEVAFTIDHAISVPTNITGLSFSTTSMRGFIIQYSIRRYANTIQLVQIGKLRATYNTKTTTWFLSDDFTGENAGVTFSITAAGQMQYTSSTFADPTGYWGSMEYTIDRVFSYP